VAMIPHERSLVKRMGGRPFALVGVNSDANREYLRKMNREREVTWRSFWCGKEGTGGPIPTEWNVSGWPTLYYLDHRGVIRHKNLREEKEIDAAVEELVREAEQAAGSSRGK
jgi:hypothetical protein